MINFVLDIDVKEKYKTVTKTNGGTEPPSIPHEEAEAAGLKSGFPGNCRPTRRKVTAWPPNMPEKRAFISPIKKGGVAPQTKKIYIFD
ncbi:hypothetical protein GMSM_33970 [Geomonas sp. Red276]